MRPIFIPLAAIVTLAVAAGGILGWWWLPLVAALGAGGVLAFTRKPKP